MTPDSDAIRALLVRYATAIDTRDWDLLRSCFTDDAVTDYGDIGRWTSVEGIAAFMQDSHAGLGATNHMISNIEVEVDGDEATARAYVHAVLATDGDPQSWIDSVGTYDDRLVRTPAGWRIAERTFRLTRMVFGDAGR